jgi:hypothetical protein
MDIAGVRVAVEFMEMVAVRVSVMIHQVVVAEVVAEPKVLGNNPDIPVIMMKHTMAVMAGLASLVVVQTALMAPMPWATYHLTLALVLPLGAVVALVTMAVVAEVVVALVRI